MAHGTGGTGARRAALFDVPFALPLRLELFPGFESAVHDELDMSNVSLERAQIALSAWRKAVLKIELPDESGPAPG